MWINFRECAFFKELCQVENFCEQTKR